VRLRPPFIGDWRGVARSIQVPSQDLGAFGTICLAFFILFVGSVPIDIPYALYVRDVPSMGQGRSLARG
jgi:hypothetical protein